MNITLKKCYWLLNNQQFYTSYLNDAIRDLLEMSFPNGVSVTIPVVVKEIIKTPYLDTQDNGHRKIIDGIVYEAALTVSTFSGLDGIPNFLELVENGLEDYGLLEYLESGKLKESNLKEYYISCYSVYNDVVPLLAVGDVVFCVNLGGQEDE